jgi:hypothetical protein
MLITQGRLFRAFTILILLSLSHILLRLPARRRQSLSFFQIFRTGPLSLHHGLYWSRPAFLSAHESQGFMGGYSLAKKDTRSGEVRMLTL